MKSDLKTGDRVQVVECGAGILSGKVGAIIDNRHLKTNGRGIPLLPGHYKPFKRLDEFLIRGDDGELFTMFKNYLHKYPRG